MTDRTDFVYEQLLVLRCQIGSEAAFAELVRRYGPRVRRYLRRLLDRPEDVEDAIQEVWADVFRGLWRLRDNGALAAWMYRIARDRAYRALRRQHVKCVPLIEADLPEDAPEPGLTPEEIQQVHLAMDRLSIEHREVLLLRFMEDMSPEQIGQVIGCPAGTVRSRLHYAKRELRKELQRRQEHERTQT